MVPERPGIRGDLPREQGFPPEAGGDYRERAGASGALLRDLRGMRRCLICKPAALRSDHDYRLLKVSRHGVG
jgi:hypothetical protein